MNEPWFEKKRWRVSQTNYRREITATYNFPKKIQILDTTLRDGEQQPGVFIKRDDRIRFVKQLDLMGVQRIEAGNPSISKQDSDSVKAITDLGLDANIYVFSRAMASDAELAKECGVDGVIMEIPGSEHLLKYGKGWSVEKAINAAIEGTLAAKELGLTVSFFPADSSRTEIEYLLDMIDAVKSEGHIDSMVLVDTFGCYTPEAAGFTVDKIKKRFPELPVEVHFHEDFQLGAANTIAAFKAGADVAHTTVNGLGERAGSVPMEPLLLSLELLYGVDTGINLEKLIETSRLLSEISGVDVPPHKAIVGEQIFTYETGLPWSLWKKCRDENPTAMFAYMWSETGHEGPNIVIGKKSGKDNIQDYLKQLGIEAKESQLAEMVQLVKDKAYEVGRALTKEEFVSLYESVDGSK